MLRRALDVVSTGNWPWFGMSSGAGLRNPGLSVWFFGLWAHVSADPLFLLFTVQALNVLALVLAFFFIRKSLPESEREPWYLGLAIFAVAPIPILFSRKIWAQDLLPFFSILTLWAYVERKKFWGAFLWGFFGVILGQIHMSGFFLCMSLGLCTVGEELWKKKLFRETRWGALAIGFFLALLPLLPWLGAYLKGERGAGGSWQELGRLSFFKQSVLSLFSWNLDYSLGPDFWNFLAFPNSLYAVGALLIVTALVAFFALAELLKGGVKLWAPFPMSRRLFWVFWLGTGLLMTLSKKPLHLHYLIVLFPMPFIFLGHLLFRKKTVAYIFLGAQLLLSLLFLLYIHSHQGSVGDYGPTYRSQQKI